MRDLSKPDEQALEQTDAAKLDKHCVLEERITEAESAKTETKPNTDAANMQPQEVENFRNNFKGVDGSEGVANKASSDNSNINDRNGARHQIEGANKLGKENIKEFESIYETGNDNGRVDIVANDGIAVECKYSYDPVNKSDIDKAAAQAVRRLESGQFPGVTVVYNDGALNDNMLAYANLYENEYPNLRFCERSELNKVLKQMRHSA